ncbi:CHAD domain-containing protein [Novosphingobium marinum]|uniref:CHAD domain-containing protein n=1 Tax=Novosphingobium marinum TaxID=1514948 RepID=A0A7Z0BUH1_9SPHN|nr:CHAD domain-containing protein [Novosphingobium marinum]NYH96259.1 CHAD domain-containing protein [Novosphingobium marinum]GGC33736.1 CHAD domain-containing protein [Novosphingobium marinum]
MAYRIKSKDNSVQDALRRIAGEQIGKALHSIEKLDRPDAVHDVRKRCKKLRGLIRLVRPAFDGYGDENEAFRDTARLISEARDAKVMQDTYDELMHHFRGQVDRRALGSIRRRFTMDRKATVSQGDIGDALDEARSRLLEARERSRDWSLDAKGWDAVAGGLAKTYGRARDAAEEARCCPGPDAFHELRKRIKYHWYHSRLLENVWPDMMEQRQKLAKELSDIFGDHHDLSVFEEQLAANPHDYGDPRNVETAIGLARGRKMALEEQGWPRVQRLLAQSPEDLAAHLGALWGVWLSEGKGTSKLEGG